MGTIRREAILGALATPALLGVLSRSSGLDVPGWVTGLAAGWAATALLGAGRARSLPRAILPADWVTLTRALLGSGVAGLVVDSFSRPLPLTPLVVLAGCALVLDGVDGPVARRTGTATPLGARFDGEVDAFLILVLSVAVSREYGGWVLAIGAARYVFLVAGWSARWLAAPLPFRYWRKVVAAVQGIVLTAAASGLLPRSAGTAAVAAAMVLLAESFGRDVVWLYRTGAGSRTRLALRITTTLGAAVVVWAALVAPARLDELTPAAFARIPIEALGLVAIGLLLPAGPRRAVAALAGLGLGLLTIVKILDAGFYEELGRPFDPVLDWGDLGPAIGVVRDSIGAAATDGILALVLLAVAAVLTAVTVSAVRVSTVTAQHRRLSAGGVTLLTGVWAAGAGLSVQLVPGTPLASTTTAALAVTHGRDAERALRDQLHFQKALHSADPYAGIPASDLLSGLRGKDVIVAFVESYGQVAVQGTTFSAGVDTVLRRGAAALGQAGYSARSAFLDSPTFGGVSWLAHSTLHSGLWVDSPERYDELTSSDRFTLSDAFGKAGWRTVSDIPSNDWPWPQGTSFYHYDQLYDRHNVGYHGPTFSYASMPDQFTLAAFQRLELAPGHAPVMAEIDLVSSHIPWTPLPRMVPWNQLGDGSVFDPMPGEGLSPQVAWRNTDTVRALYGQSIQYSLQALISWVIQAHDDNLVLVLLGDHQPNTTVSGAGANHQVPISIVAADPAVMAHIAGWKWQDGLLPTSSAPLWPMDAFRNRFLDAFDRSSAPAALASAH